MTRDEIRGIVEGISDEQLKKILDINSADIGKAKRGFEDLKAQLDEAHTKSARMEEELSRLGEMQCEADKVREKMEELQTIIDEKNRAEKEMMQESALNQRFCEASRNMEFINEFTRKGILSRFKDAVLDEGNAGRDDGEIFDSLVEGQANLFAPRDGIPAVVAPTMGFGGSITDADVREIMGLK